MTLRELLAVLAKVPPEYLDCEVVSEEEGTMRDIGPVIVTTADYARDTVVVHLDGNGNVGPVMWEEPK